MQDGGEYVCEASNSAVDNQGNIIVKNLSIAINIECKGIDSFLTYVVILYYSSQPLLEI